MRTRELRIDLPDEVLDAIAARAAELVLERLDAQPSTQSELLSVQEAADFLRCSRQRVYDLLSSGRLERFKDGSRVLVRRADLVAHLLPSGSRERMGRGAAR
jgi:excisionase family DNA binding protein